MKIDGIKVVDANKRLRIKITDNDVTKGNTKDPGSCAAARALMRTPECTKARVHIGRTYLFMGDKWVKYMTPRALRTEIVAFDRGGGFEPGEYTLSPIPPSARAASAARRATGSATNKTGKKATAKKRAPYHVVSGIRQHGANR